MNTITLRRAIPQDSEFAYHTKKAAFRDYVEKIWGWNEDEQRKLHEQRFRSQDVQIINLGGIDIGTIAVVVTPDCVRVNQLFILPEHQSKGIGHTCMMSIMEEAQRQGLPVYLRVLKVNPRALTFYRRLGFIPTGETNTHIIMEKNSLQATKE